MILPPIAATNKEVLVDNLWKSMKEEQRKPSGDVQNVLDVGALLHRVPSKKDKEG